MKEININIEGYNVNGICVGCLNYNRKMYYSKEIKECLKLIADIEVPDGLEVQMCWECLARVRSVLQFQDQVLRCYDVLIDYSTKQTFLNSPSDLTLYSTQILTVSEVNVVEFDPREPLEGQTDKTCAVDVKTEIEVEVEDLKQERSFPDLDYEVDVEIDKAEPLSDEDDVTLSSLKSKREKGREKKGKKKRKETPDDIKPISSKKAIPDIMERIELSEEEMWKLREEDKRDKTFLSMKYTCDLCIIGFNAEKLMKHHMKSKHVSKGPRSVQCAICSSFLLSGDHLARHTSQHRAAMRCRVCAFTTSARRAAAAHAATHSDYACPRCHARFSSKSKMAYHRSACHQQRPQCDCCGKVFASKMTLQNHLNGKKEVNKVPPEKLYLPCKGCDKVFHSKKSYRAHVVIHDGLTYPCQVCGKPFQWKRNLARHMRNHRDKDQGAVHECRECGKKFSSRDCLNNHMRLSRKHVNENNYTHSCSFCGKRFATRWCMVDHVDWEHLQRVKYQCQHCFKAFKTAKIMVAHVNNMHVGKKGTEEESEHLCDICGKSYKSARRLKGHVWAMHTSRARGRSFRCSLCPATFTWQTSVYKHLNMMHHKRPAALRNSKKEPLLSDLQFFQNSQPHDVNVNAAL